MLWHGYLILQTDSLSAPDRAGLIALLRTFGRADAHPNPSHRMHTSPSPSGGDLVLEATYNTDELTPDSLASSISGLWNTPVTYNATSCNLNSAQTLQYTFTNGVKTCGVMVAGAGVGDWIDSRHEASAYMLHNPEWTGTRPTNSAQLQAVINAGAGGLVVLSGKYLLDTMLVIPSNTILQGVNCHLFAAGLDYILDIGNTDGVALRGLLVDGGGTCVHGIGPRSGPASNLEISHCVIQNMQEAGFRSPYPITGLTIIDNAIRGMHGFAGTVTGLSPNYVTGGQILRNIFSDIGDDAGDWALYVSGAGSGLVIMDNTANDCIGGFKIAPAMSQTDVNMTNNSITTTQEASIVLSNVDSAILVNNKITTPGTGMRLSTIGSGTIRGGEIAITGAANPRFGILTHDVVTNLTVDGVFLTCANGGIAYGIGLLEGDGILIENCITSGFLYPVGQYTDHLLTALTVRNNTLTGEGTHGAALLLANIDGGAVYGNTCKNIQFWLDWAGAPTIANVEAYNNRITAYCQNWGRVTGAIAVSIHDNQSSAQIPDTWFSLSGDVTLSNNTVL